MNKYIFHFIEEDEKFKVYKINETYTKVCVDPKSLIYDTITNEPIGRTFQLHIIRHNEDGSLRETPLYEAPHHKIVLPSGEEITYELPPHTSDDKLIGLLEEEDE